MKNFYCFSAVLLFLFLTTGLYAEKNYTSEKVIFLPQDFYVGDLVEMRVVIMPDEGVLVEKPETVPDSYWVKIENAEVYPVDNEYELRIFLRSFSPGIRTLPPIQFGEVMLRDIRIQTGSVLSTDVAPFAPPAGQMLLPGTNYYIALIIGLVFLLPIFFIFFWTKLKRGVLSFIFEQRRRRPYRRLMKVLKELEEKINERKGKAFYTILIDELRLYLTARGSIDYSVITARESAHRLVADFMKIPGCSDLIRIFKLADEVKFGSKRVMISRREEDLYAVRMAVEEIEAFMAGGEKNVDI